MAVSAPLVGLALVSQFLAPKDNVASKVKLKKRPPKNDSVQAAPPDSPILNAIEPSLRESFPSGRPLGDLPSIIQCKHCKKPMLQSVAYPHIRECLRKKNEKAQKKKEQKEANRKAREAQQKAERAEGEAAHDDDDDESVVGENRAGGAAAASGAAASATGKKSGAVAGKKRKAEGEGDKAPTKKKTKKELEAAKPKAAKPKGPVDVEKQCGVLLPNGQMCARSLTCKSHAMGAKRAVPGRSQRYDVLLAAYQKKNQAKQQKAAIDANAPLLDDAADEAGPVDSDEETELVMAGLARARPRPLDQHVHVPMRRKCHYLRVKELLSSALGGARGSVFAGVGGAAAASASVGASAGAGAGAGAGGGGEGDGRRMSFAQPGGARPPGANAGSAPSRKPSGAGVVTGTPAPIAT